MFNFPAVPLREHLRHGLYTTRSVLPSQEDIFRQDSQLEGVTVDRSLPSSGPSMTQHHQEDAEQLTVNMPNLLDRPVPAKPNPMARFAESSKLYQLMLLQTFVKSSSLALARK